MITANPARYYFEDIGKQAHATRLGMWLFLASEILFFIGLIALYWSYRAHYLEAFEEGVHHNDLWLGTINTAILLTSSYFVALAVAMERTARSRFTALFLWLAAGLGVVFLILKGIEYTGHIREGAIPGGAGTAFFEDKPYGMPVFFSLYYATTGLHAIHMIIGVVLLTTVGIKAWRGRVRPPYDYVVENAGLYWHFVDVVWIFLWPMFYLMRELA